MTDRNYTCVADAVQPSKRKPVRKPLSKAEFIEKASSIHGSKFDYSEVAEKKKKKEKVKITCTVCGYNFERIVSCHINRDCGCRSCAGRATLTQEQFIERAIEIHGKSYNYSKVIYKSAHKKVSIICNSCHTQFEQSPSNHTNGKQGCPKCFGKHRLTTEQFIERSNKKHNNFYDYSKTNYVTNNKKVIIICPEHGEFLQAPHVHMAGGDCNKCADKVRHQKTRQPFSWFLEKANEKHNSQYIYDESSYTNVSGNVKVFCKLHGWFEQNVKNHLYAGKGCRQCGLKNSGGFNRSSFKKHCNRHNGIGTLYVIKCFDDDEVFYKVGITSRTVKIRYSSVAKLPYKFTELFNIDGEPQFIYDLEVRLHSLLREYHYEPTKEFKGGVYECFSHIPKSVIKLLKDLENTPQLQLIA